MPNQEIEGEFGKLTAIVEYWGVLAYSSTPDNILNRYLDLLCDDGAIYLMSGTKFLDDFHTKRSAFIGSYSLKKGLNKVISTFAEAPARRLTASQRSSVSS